MNGKSLPGLENAMALARAVNVSLDYPRRRRRSTPIPNLSPRSSANEQRGDDPPPRPGDRRRSRHSNILLRILQASWVTTSPSHRLVEAKPVVIDDGRGESATAVTRPSPPSNSGVGPTRPDHRAWDISSRKKARHVEGSRGRPGFRWFTSVTRPGDDSESLALAARRDSQRICGIWSRSGGRRGSPSGSTPRRSPRRRGDFACLPWR